MDNLDLPDTYRPPPDLLKDRVILITGAGQGLGKAAALACARHGASVILHGRNTKKLEQTYDEIAAAGCHPATIFPLDLAAATDKDFGRLEPLGAAPAHPQHRDDLRALWWRRTCRGRCHFARA